MHVLEVIFYLWALNIITIICCIPIFTIGAALTAMQHQLYLIAKNEDGYVFRGYFKDFAANFKRSTPAGLIMTFFGGVLGYDLYIFAYGLSSFNSWFKCAIFALALVYMFIYVYLFPVLARYDCSLKLAFKNALFMSVYKIFMTVPMVVMTLLPVILTAIVQNFFIWDILFGLTLPAFINVFMYKGIFEAFEKNQESKKEGTEAAEATKSTEAAEEAKSTEAAVTDKQEKQN